MDERAAGRPDKKTRDRVSNFGFRTNKIGADVTVNFIVENENEIMKYMVEDLCQWLSQIVGQDMELTPEHFFPLLEDGVILCRLANSIQDYAIKAAEDSESNPLGRKIKYKSSDICQRDKSRFQARENVCKFLDWCRSHGIPTPMLFESNDIVVGGRDGGREVIICLMNLAKRFSIDYYVPAPETIKVEVEYELKNKRERQSAKLKAGYYKSEETTATSLDNSTTSHSDRTTEVTQGSYHFGNYSDKIDETELPARNLKSLISLFCEGRSDETLDSDKENANKKSTKSKLPFAVPYGESKKETVKGRSFGGNVPRKVSLKGRTLTGSELRKESTNDNSNEEYYIGVKSQQAYTTGDKSYYIGGKSQQGLINNKSYYIGGKTQQTFNNDQSYIGGNNSQGFVNDKSFIGIKTQKGAINEKSLLTGGKSQKGAIYEKSLIFEGKSQQGSINDKTGLFEDKSQQGVTSDKSLLFEGEIQQGSINDKTRLFEGKSQKGTINKKALLFEGEIQQGSINDKTLLFEGKSQQGVFNDKTRQFEGKSQKGAINDKSHLIKGELRKESMGEQSFIGKKLRKESINEHSVVGKKQRKESTNNEQSFVGRKLRKGSLNNQSYVDDESLQEESNEEYFFGLDSQEGSINDEFLLMGSKLEQRSINDQCFLLGSKSQQGPNNDQSLLTGGKIQQRSTNNQFLLMGGGKLQQGSNNDQSHPSGSQIKKGSISDQSHLSGGKTRQGSINDKSRRQFEGEIRKQQSMFEKSSIANKSQDDVTHEEYFFNTKSQEDDGEEDTNEEYFFNTRSQEEAMEAKDEYLFNTKPQQQHSGVYCFNENKGKAQHMDNEQSKQVTSQVSKDAVQSQSFTGTNNPNNPNNPNKATLFQILTVNDDIIDTIADTVMLVNDKGGETIDDMEQVLLGEGNLSSAAATTSSSSEQHTLTLSRGKDGNIYKVETTSNIQESLPIDELNKCKIEAHTTQFDEFGQRKKSLSQEYAESILYQHLRQIESTSIVDKLSRERNQSKVSTASSCERCRSVCEALVCENCEKSLGQDSQIYDLNYQNESEYFCWDQGLSAQSSLVADDLEHLKNFCQILSDSGPKMELPLLKFVCIQLGEKFIFIKKVKGQMFVRYSRQWLSMDTLIEDITISKSTSNFSYQAETTTSNSPPQ